jgi:hypothetical protein
LKIHHRDTEVTEKIFNRRHTRPPRLKAKPMAGRRRHFLVLARVALGDTRIARIKDTITKHTPLEYYNSEAEYA